MKVLFIQNIAGIAGSEKYFLAIMPELKKRHIDCSFLAIYRKEDKGIAQKFCRLLNNESIITFEFEISSYSSLRPVLEINRLQKLHQFDILHTHLIYADFWSALSKVLFNNKAKIVSTLHGYQESLYIKYCLHPEKLPKTFYYFLAKFALKKIDHVYSCSYGLRTFYERSGIVKPKKIKVIQHGFDYPEMEVTERKNNSPQLVILGRLIERKGHHFVLACMPELIKKFPDLKLVIVGDGEEEKNLQAMAAELKIDGNIRFEGYRMNVRDYLAAADVVVVSSYAEGLPLVIFEAFSAHKPVIAFDTIGCNEAVKNNVNGLLIEPFNVNDLRDGIERLLSDPESRKEFGENGFSELKSHFSLKRMTDETAALYEFIVQTS